MEENRSGRPREQWLSLMRELESQLPILKKICSSPDKTELIENFSEHLENSQRDFKELATIKSTRRTGTMNAITAPLLMTF